MKIAIAAFVMALVVTCFAAENNLQEANAKSKTAAGFRFEHIIQGSIYDKMGLKNGDIVLEINGKPVNSPKVAEEFISSLKTSEMVDLKIKRSGKIEKLKYLLK